VARDESDGLGRDVDGDAILGRARRSADATVAAARVEAERLLVAARAEAAELREQGRVEGADLTQQAAFEAEQTLADAHAAAGALLSSARAEADRVVRAAHERTSPGAGPGNPELDTHVAAAVASAVAAAGDAATTHAGDGSALIGAAQRLVERLRDELQAVLGPTAGSVTSLGSSVRALDELAGPPSDPSATEGGSPASADVPRRIPAHPATHPASAEVTAGQGTDAADDADGRQEHRGPLGQLFGAARR
jgi:V/A-type H+-transporting ATPase subunit G/H